MKVLSYVLTMPPFVNLFSKFGVFSDKVQAVEFARQLNRFDPNYRGRGVKVMRSDISGQPLKWKKVKM